MNVTQHQQNGVLILALQGRMTGDPSCQFFHDEVKKAASAGHLKIVLDLGELEWVGSSGLGLLISALTSVRNASGELKLARISRSVQSLLAMTKLNTVFETYRSVDDAIVAFH